MNELVVLDSHGSEDVHGRYKDLLAHCTFEGITPKKLKGYALHGHGGWCAWSWLAQQMEPWRCIFLRMFDDRGRGQLTPSEIIQLYRDLGPRSPGVKRHHNWSWGGAIDTFSDNWIRHMTEILDGDLITIAAGNSGSGKDSHPARDMSELPNVIVVGAVDDAYRRTSWSQTGEPGGEPYVTTAFLGIGLSLSALTGKVVSWQGTSLASPNCGGALSSNQITGAQATSFLRAYSLADHDDDGIPNGISEVWVPRIMAGKYHHEVGVGVAEGLRQAAMKKTGRDLRATVGSGKMSLGIEPTYHDFERIN